MDTGVLNRALLSKCLQSPREILMWNKAKLKYILYSLFVRSKRKFYGRRERRVMAGSVFSSFPSLLGGKPPSSLPSPREQSIVGISWTQARLKHSFSTSQL